MLGRKEEKIDIELSEKHNGKKFLLFIVLLAFGLFMIGRGLFSALTTDSGWREIEPQKTAELNCGDEFVLMYNIGASGIAATVEYKEIVNLYSEASMKAYQLFTPYSSYDGIHNMSYINHHPNEEVEVDEVLYEAFELLQKYENRNLYYGPIYTYYDNLFYVSDESELVHYDPYTSEEIKTYYEEAAGFANNSEHIHLELLGNQKVKLSVSDEYLQYAQENGIENFVDFYWMKNAFIIDYLAETLINGGHTLGTLSSYDGFCRNLDDSETVYAFNVYDKQENGLYEATVLQYSGARSIVNLRNFAVSEKENQRIYTLKNGELRTNYVVETSIDSLISYSSEFGCAEIMLQMSPIYLADDFELLNVQDIYSIYCEDQTIYYNEEQAKFTEAYQSDLVKYELKFINE